MRYRKHSFSIAFFALFSLAAALLPMASHAAAYPPLSATDGKPAAAAHLVRLEKGMVEMAIQVLAPGKILEAVRIDNLGGVSSRWRSDSKDGAAPLSVSRGGVSLSSGAQAMSLALGDTETLLSLSFKDNGAFAGKSTDFRATVFFSGGGRAMVALAARDFPTTAFAQAGQTAPASPANEHAAPTRGGASDPTAAGRIDALAEQNNQPLELTQKKADTPPQAAGQEPSAITALAESEPSPASPQESQAQKAAPLPAAPKQQYRPGWLARIISIPEGFNITDPLPPLEVVNFVATESSYGVTDYCKLVEGAFKVYKVLWKTEAFLHAEEEGNYIFSINAKSAYSPTGPPLRAIYVEGNQVGVEEGDDETLLAATYLEPGLYRIEFRIAHNQNTRYRWNSSDAYNYNFTLQIKRPSDNGMVPASQILLLPISSAGNK